MIPQGSTDWVEPIEIMVVLVEIYPTIPKLFGHNWGSVPIGVWAFSFSISSFDLI
jgi:hypothetical protein